MRPLSKDLHEALKQGALQNPCVRVFTKLFSKGIYKATMEGNLKEGTSQSSRLQRKGSSISQATNMPLKAFTLVCINIPAMV